MRPGKRKQETVVALGAAPEGPGRGRRKGRFAPPGRPPLRPQGGHERENIDTCVHAPLQVAALRWIGWPETPDYARMRAEVE